MSIINIKGTKRSAILQALYNNSKPIGFGVMQYEEKDMTNDEAFLLLLKNSEFDYIKGRVMKVIIDIDLNELDTSLYDRDNGEGAAYNAIKHLLKNDLKKED